MMSRKNIALLTALILSVSLLSSGVTALILSAYNQRNQFHVLAGICERIIEKAPSAESAILSALKQQKGFPITPPENNILTEHGYVPSDFQNFGQQQYALLPIASILTSALLLLLPLWHWRKSNDARIDTLTAYLEKINLGKPGLLIQSTEDAFSKLQDELYKTVTTLHQTRDAALNAKSNFAENLSNIAHQFKTPITAASLSLQLLRNASTSEACAQVQRHLDRLTRLGEALLLLSRIDAGGLPLTRAPVDVFTALTLAADNLEETLGSLDVSIEIAEREPVKIMGDLEWTMEALLNLMQNCAEHAPPGSAIHCDYDQNPLYTEIRIWDEGNGFDKEDLPHIFERFYRGKNAKAGGIGIGLALSRAIFEMEHGMISAKNLPEGGAYFEIRLYSH